MTYESQVSLAVEDRCLDALAGHFGGFSCVQGSGEAFDSIV